MFKGLSLEHKNIQTQKCAAIQCKIWPRNIIQNTNAQKQKPN